jgi:hypothetical protein
LILNKLGTECAPGANPDTSAIEPEQIKGSLRGASCVWNVEDSRVGPGVIEASVKANDGTPLVDLTLKWVSGHYQPETWQIEWCHEPDYLLTELTDYLLDFCPVGQEMVEVLGMLGLENLPTFADDGEAPSYGNN